MVFYNYIIGRRIKLLRKQKGITQQELAQILGKSLRTIQKYESGEIELSIAIVHQLTDLLETTPTYLLGYEEEPIVSGGKNSELGSNL